jgi:hypothetical protein
MATGNPCGVDGDVPLVSVGFTYGYSRTGPLRGHSHLTSGAPNFYVAHALGPVVGQFDVEAAEPLPNLIGAPPLPRWFLPGHGASADAQRLADFASQST